MKEDEGYGLAGETRNKIARQMVHSMYSFVVGRSRASGMFAG